MLVLELKTSQGFVYAPLLSKKLVLSDSMLCLNLWQNIEAKVNTT